MKENVNYINLGIKEGEKKKMNKMTKIKERKFKDFNRIDVLEKKRNEVIQEKTENTVKMN